MIKGNGGWDTTRRRTNEGEREISTALATFRVRGETAPSLRGWLMRGGNILL